MARNFKELRIWKEGYDLVLDIYRVTNKFPESERLNIVSQMNRAGTSIPLNIAEGCSRYTKNGFLQFLSYSYGSCRELEVLILLSKDLNYISYEEFNLLNDKINYLGAMIFSFITKVENETWLNWFK